MEETQEENDRASKVGKLKGDNEMQSKNSIQLDSVKGEDGPLGESGKTPPALWGRGFKTPGITARLLWSHLKEHTAFLWF